MELPEIIAALKAQPDAAAVIAELHREVPALYQGIFNKGHSEATAKAKESAKQANTDLVAAQSEVARLGEQVSELEKKAPETAALRQQHEAVLQDLKEKHKLKIGHLEGGILREREQRTHSEFVRRLVAGGLDADYAEVQAMKQRDRFRFNSGENGSLNLEILQSGKDIPFSPADGKDAIDMISEEVRAAAPAKFRTANTDSGAGITSGTTGGVGGYDPVKAGKAMAAAQKSGPSDLALR